MGDNYEPQKGTRVEFNQVYPPVPHGPDTITVGRWVRIQGEDDGTANSDWHVTQIVNDFARLARNGKIRAERLGKLRLTGW